VKVLLFQLDGKIPNLALMRIAAYHRDLGDEVVLRVIGNPKVMGGGVLSDGWFADRVYASAIFTRSRPIAEALLQERPDAIVGGTGWDLGTLEQIGITTQQTDYSIYPNFRQSLGFTQRGCRLNCEFCVVPKKEGKVRPEATITEIWRGDPWPKELLLLDNDFFGQPNWRDRIKEIRDGGFKVSFNQGINARCLTDEAAEAIASVDYRADDMKVRRIYTAWDSREDEERLFVGLNRLVKYGVKPDHIMVYMLIGYWPGETAADREYRRLKLREFGARPYPMPYIRNKETVGFQRWIIGAYDKRFTWQQWEAANYRPEKLGLVI
jgi:hypothetical protein